MANAFSYEFTISGSTPQEARDRVQRVLGERLRRPTSGGVQGNLHRAMRLSKQTPTSLVYKPKLQVPLPVSITVWVGRELRRENVNVTFTANGADETRVTVSGKVGEATQAVAGRDFWEGVLAASAP